MRTACSLPYGRGVLTKTENPWTDTPWTENPSGQRYPWTETLCTVTPLDRDPPPGQRSPPDRDLPLDRDSLDEDPQTETSLDKDLPSWTETPLRTESQTSLAGGNKDMPRTKGKTPCFLSKMRRLHQPCTVYFSSDIYRPKQEGNVFTGVCQSFCP